MRITIGSSTLLAALLGATLSTSGFAQGNPSSDQIMNSLRPGPGMTGGTRGIRPMMTAPGDGGGTTAHGTASRAGARATHRTAASMPSATPAAPSVNLTVDFATGSAELTPAAQRTLNELGRALESQTLNAYRFRIEGHTDTVGTPEENKTLSAARAAAVVDYLVSRFHVDRARLDAVGMGEDGLLIPTPPQRAEPRNRRVEVVNLGA